MENVQLSVEDEDKFYQAIQESGLIVCGSIGCAKTTMVKHVAERLIEDGFTVKIFDVIHDWRYNFKPKIMHQVIMHQVISNPYEKCINDFLKTRFESVVYTLNMDNEHERRAFIERILKQDLQEQKARFFCHNGDLNKFPKIFYIIEEANTILSTYSIREGFFRDFVAHSRHYNMIGLYVMQRLADSSPKVIERIPNMAIGLTIGANDLRRIKAIIPKEARNNVSFNNKYTFMLYYDGKLKAKEISPFEGRKLDDYEIQVIKQGFWRRKTKYVIVNRDWQFRQHLKGKSATKQPANDQQDTGEQLDEEMEEDLAFLGEPDEDF